MKETPKLKFKHDFMHKIVQKKLLWVFIHNASVSDYKPKTLKILCTGRFESLPHVLTHVGREWIEMNLNYKPKRTC